MKVKVLAIAAALVAGAASARTVCTWIGGDGVWSDPENWQDGVVPIDKNGTDKLGDDVYLSSSVSGAVISNDLDGITVYNLRFTGDNPVRLVGGKIKIANGVRVQTASTIDVALDIPWNVSIRCGENNSETDSSKKSVFNGDITIASGVSLYIAGGYGADFYGTIAGGSSSKLVNGTVNWAGGIFSFYGPVKVDKISQYSASQSIYKFYSTENDWREFEASSYTVYRFMSEGTMPRRSILSFSNAGAVEQWKGAYFHADQTLDRITGVDPGSTKYDMEVQWINNEAGQNGNADITMTLTGTDNAKTYAKFKRGSNLGKWSVVWAPSGNYTQEFAERAQEVSGSLTVSNGTVRVSGAGKFAMLPTLIVKDGACFDCASTASGALDKLTRLELGAGAVFSLAATATSPCSKNPMVTMGIGSKFVLPEGAAMAVGDLFSVDGRHVESGVYTGSGDSGVKVSWIEGAGTLTVTSSGGIAAWNTAEDGDWNDADAWAASAAPADGRQAFLTANGESYTATVASPPSFSPVGIKIENASEGKSTTLSVSAAMSVLPVSGKTLDIGKGGRMDVASGGEVKVVTSADAGLGTSSMTVRIHDGGEMNVAGGKFLGYGGFHGKFAVDDGGTLAVGSGSFILTNKSSLSNGIWVERGGRVELSGGDLFSSCYTTYSRPITMRGGVIDCSGDARLRIGAGFGKYFGAGTLELRGSSSLCSDHSTARALIAPYAAGDEMTVNVKDQAKWYMYGAIQTAVGFNKAGARTVMNFSSTAASELGAIAQVGCADGYGEINLSAGSLRASSYGLLIGTMDETLLNVGPGSPVRPEGKVSVSGGRLIIGGGQTANANQGLSGLSVGVCNEYAEDHAGYGSEAKGVLEVSGGQVTNELGFTSVGVAKGRGRVVQTGGEIVTSTKPVSIGSFGGEGEWIISNGVTKVLGALYLGGITAGQLDNAYQLVYSEDAPGTKGRLEIAGGSMHVNWLLTAGQTEALGSAEIEIGPEGRLYVGTDILLENTALVYRFGSSGVGAMQAGRDLKIGAGTTLEIDAGALAEKSGSYRIMTFGRDVSGDFASVTVSGIADPDACRVRRTPLGYKISFISGTSIVIR